MHQGLPSPRGKPSFLSSLFRRHPSTVGMERPYGTAFEDRIDDTEADASDGVSIRLLLACDSAGVCADITQRVQALWPPASIATRPLSAPLAKDDLSATALIVDCRQDHDAIMRILGEIALLDGSTRPHVIVLIENGDGDRKENDKNWALAIGADDVLAFPFTDADLRLLFGNAGKVSGLSFENMRLRHSLDALAQDAHRLRTLAYTDHLTGLPNRLYLTSWLAEVMNKGDADLRFAVHMLDLDGFKQINDRFGHRSGDQILRQVSERVTRISRKLDLVVRLGGDEIAIVQVGIETAADCQAFLSRLSGMFESAFEIDQRTITIGASVGTAIYPVDGETLSDLLHHADLAMYDFKPAGARRSRGRGTPPHTAMDQQRAREATYALAFGLHDGTLAGILCDTVPVPETAPTAADPFRSVRIALLQCANWKSEGPAAFFSAAVDSRALSAEDALSGLRDLLIESKADAERCEIRLLAADLDGNAEVWHQVRELGFRLAVEVDTESFSPQRLLRVPLTRLHLARAFAELDTGSAEFRILLDMAVVFARAAGARTLAHGVSSAAQMEVLRKAGIDAVAGPFVGVSVKGDELLAVRQRVLQHADR